MRLNGECKRKNVKVINTAKRDKTALTKSNGNPPNITQPSVIVKRSYNKHKDRPSINEFCKHDNQMPQP